MPKPGRQKHRGHGEGSIYQRKDGRWCAAVTTGRDAKGRLKRRYVYGETREGVTKELIILLADQQKGIPIDVSKQTVGEFLAHWLEDCVKGSVAPRTYECYEQVVRLHLVPTIGEVRLTKLTPQHVQRLYRAKADAGLSPRMVQLIHAVLRRALAQATKWGLVPRNPCDLVEKPKVRRKEMSTLSPEEANLLLQAAEGDRLHGLLVLAVSCGLREGELLGLKWEDVDLDSGRLTVQRQVQWIREKPGEPKRPTLTQPKTAKSRRTVPLPSATVAALKRHKARQAEERLKLGEAWQDWGLVFPTHVGTPYDPATLLRSFRRLLEKAGLPRIRFHDLRHTCATLLLAQGVHPKLVQEQLGHAQIAVTLDTYSHITAPMMKEAARKMDEILAAGKDKRR